MPKSREPRPPRSAEDLEEAARQIGYELWMLCETERQLHELASTGRAQPADGVRANALLESHLVHARALMEFLGVTGRAPYDDDITPGDFGVTLTLGEVERQWYDGRMTDLNKHLAHLTWSRVHDGPGDTTPRAELVGRLLRDYARFTLELGATPGGRELRAQLTMSRSARPVTAWAVCAVGSFNTSSTSMPTVHGDFRTAPTYR